MKINQIKNLQVKDFLKAIEISGIKIHIIKNQEIIKIMKRQIEAKINHTSISKLKKIHKRLWGLIEKKIGVKNSMCNLTLIIPDEDISIYVVLEGVLSIDQIENAHFGIFKNLSPIQKTVLEMAGMIEQPPNKLLSKELSSSKNKLGLGSLYIHSN